MSKFNRPNTRSNVFSPVKTESVATSRTYEGAPGFARDAKSELFLLAVSNMVSEKTFYEDANTRDDRYIKLIREVASDVEWLTGFFSWLRSEANMRSASLVGALEAVKARLDAGYHGDNRQLVASVLQRPDEPGEALAYWFSNHGRNLPMPVKRGVADAANRMYTEKNLIKYDTASYGFRFGDVIELTHPSPYFPDDFFDNWTEERLEGMTEDDFLMVKENWKARKSELFKYAIERGKGREFDAPESLQVIHNNRRLMSLDVNQRRSIVESEDVVGTLRSAGMTWENLAGWLQGPMDRVAWEAIIPSMGYMALLRNLRNFDEAQVSDEVAQRVANKLSDPAEVASSRQLPMRFLTAYRNAPSLRWSYPLEKALNLSLRNIPRMGGRTLILVDTSSSMHCQFSSKTQLMRWDVAALFGIAMANACDQSDVVSFSSNQRYYHDPIGSRTKQFPIRVGESILRSIQRWDVEGYFLGGGTQTELALQEHYRNHDRVVIFTDEQASGYGVGSSLPKSTPMYTWNLAGYEYGHAPSGEKNRHVFAGLGDSAFKMIPLLEQGQSSKWPWQNEQ